MITNTVDGVGVVLVTEYEEVAVGAMVEEELSSWGFVIGPASKKCHFRLPCQEEIPLSREKVSETEKAFTQLQRVIDNFETKTTKEPSKLKFLLYHIILFSLSLFEFLEVNSLCNLKTIKSFDRED